MKKGKITVTITIGIACLALATIMFMQFKIVNQADINELEVMREEELRTELANWKENYQEAELQYQQKAESLKEYNEKEASDSEKAELVWKELARSKSSFREYRCRRSRNYYNIKGKCKCRGKYNSR